MTYRGDALTSAQREAIAARLAAADHGLLGAAGTLASVRREIERAVASRTLAAGRGPGPSPSRADQNPGYPSVSALVSALTDAQALVHEAHGELAAVDGLLDRPRSEPLATPMLPDPPRLGHAPPADARSRKWWPAAYDPVGMLLWYLRYRPWWSTLDLAGGVVHEARVALREREREVIERSEAHARAPILPALDGR